VVNKNAILFIFHKVVYRHSSDEVENVYITLWQIYSGVRTLIRISSVLQEVSQKPFSLLFIGRQHWNSQRTRFHFYKVVYRHYSGEVGNTINRVATYLLRDMTINNYANFTDFKNKKEYFIMDHRVLSQKKPDLLHFQMTPTYLKQYH